MDGKVKLEGGYFYTLLKNAIVTKDAQYQGKDSVMFNGSLSKVQSSQNADEAYVQGAWGSIYADFTDNVSFKSTLNYTLGEYKDKQNDTLIPMDHIAPMFGQTSLFIISKNLRAKFMFVTVPLNY